tara:strand:- start:1785 stop:2282 length:498 start_codon:yes stop_codon:yes gene_type:complete
MATIKINEIIRKFKSFTDLHPNINSFGCGDLDDLSQDTHYYPYCWILMTDSHSINYSTDNGYRSIEYNFVIRIGDKRNLQTGYDGIAGIGKDNTLDIISNTFNYVLDYINTISENTLNVFDDIALTDDINIEPFYNEDNGDVCGNEATITLRVKNDKVCITPFTV